MSVDTYKPRAIRIVEQAIGDARHDPQSRCSGRPVTPVEIMRKQVHPRFAGIRCLAMYRIFKAGCPAWVLKAMFGVVTDRSLDQALGRGLRLDRGGQDA